MQTFKPYRIASYSTSGEFQGVLSPSTLQFDDPAEAETVMARYAAKFKGVYRVVRVDSCGYILADD